MSFTQRMVGRPVTVLMIFLIVAALGGIMLQQLAVDLFPEVEPPLLAVSTSYQADPEEVEENVTAPIEGAVANVGGLDMLSSTSSRGSSVIIMEFGWGVDMTETTNDVRDALERVTGALPDDATDPQILRFDPNEQPIMTISLSGDRSPEELRVIAEDELESPLERVPGVGQANVVGGREEIVSVTPDGAALEAYGLTVSGVADAIGRGSRERSAGSITADGRDLLVRASSEYRSLSSLESVVVGMAGQRGERRPVRLREIAQVGFRYDEADSYVYVDEEPAVRISLIPESEANTVAVAEEVRATLDEIRPTLAEGITLTVTSDRSTIISDTLDQVSASLLTGALLAMGVLLLFLHNLRAAITIGISIPVSLLATFLAMGARGLTLNLLSMSGLVLGIGLIVDSSIVVLENIERQRRGGLGIKEAATVGTAEMVTAITAGALTTISVFLPIIVFSDQLGFIGILFNDISFVIIVSIVSALAVAALLVPVLASTYLPLGGAAPGRGGERRSGDPGGSGTTRSRGVPFARVGASIERGLTRLEDGFAWLLERALQWRAITIAAAFAALIASFALIPSLDVIFAPPQPQEGVSAQLTLRPGTELAETDSFARGLGGEVRERFPEIDTLVVESGAEGGFGPFGGTATNTATLDVTLPPLDDRTITTEQVERFIRSRVGSRPAATLSFSQAGPQLGAADPIDVVVQSESLDAVTSSAQEVLTLIRERFPEVTEPGLDIGDPAPQLIVRVNRDRAADLDVAAGRIVGEIRSAFAGATPAQFTREGTEWDIVVRLPESGRRTVQDLQSLVVRSNRGEAVPIANLADIELDQTPTEINREDQIRTIHVTGGLAPGIPASRVQPRISAAIAEQLDLPPEVEVEFSGELAEIEETSRRIGLVFLLAVFLVFAIMAAQFESFRMPFIIFFTIPLMLIGAILIHAMLGAQVSMFSLIGLVVLAGIVVNNAIVLVDYTNLLRVRGHGIFDAAREAGRIRFRPILMTTFTTILGMTPLAFFPGEGAELTQPVALTIVGGLAVSALTTLFVVPALYTVLSGRGEVRKSDVAA